MKIGISEQIITPELPVYLAGFAAERKAEDIKSDLFVKSIIFEKANEYYGFISYDLIGLGEEFMDLLDKAMEKINLKSSKFIISCTHTHSAPGGLMQTSSGLLKGLDYLMGVYDQALIDFIVDKTMHCLKQALNHMEKGYIEQAVDTLQNVGSNRNNQQFPGDNKIYLLRLHLESNKKVLLINFACHPTIYNDKNTSISSDYPGEVNTLFKKKGYQFVMFINGSCGDISTRFTRASTGDDEINRVTNLFLSKLTLMENNLLKEEINTLQAFVKFHQIKIKKADSIEIAQKKLEDARASVEDAIKNGLTGADLRTVESIKEGALANLAHAKKALTIDSYEVMINFFCLNNEIFVGIPGELFSQLSNLIKQERVHFVSYANTYLGYFADNYAYDNNFYEALSSPFAKGEAEKMMHFIEEEINKIEKELK